MGCLTLPMRFVAFALVALLALGAWIYRDELLRYGRVHLKVAPVSQPTTGRPGAAALSRARLRIDSLERGSADSVVLSADETASLLRSGLRADVADQLDSLRVQLGDGRVGFTADLRTARLPHELLGPLAIAVNAHEPIAAEGPIRLAAPGVGEWDVDRFRIRDIPVPREAIPKLMARAFGDSTRRGLAVRLPRSARGLRVRPDGLTLYARERQ